MRMIHSLSVVVLVEHMIAQAIVLGGSMLPHLA